jgi:hypothetical protein
MLPRFLFHPSYMFLEARVARGCIRGLGRYEVDKASQVSVLLGFARTRGSPVLLRAKVECFCLGGRT